VSLQTLYRLPLGHAPYAYGVVWTAKGHQGAVLGPTRAGYASYVTLHLVLLVPVFGIPYAGSAILVTYGDRCAVL